MANHVNFEKENSAISQVRIVTDIPYDEVTNYSRLYVVGASYSSYDIRIISPKRITQNGVEDSFGNLYSSFFSDITNAENYARAEKLKGLQKDLERLKNEAEAVENQIASLS